MKGAALAANRKFESEVCLAWHVGAFTGAAFAGKLKSLTDYQAKAEVVSQTPEQMLAMLESMKSSGTPMDIRKVN